MSTTNANTSSTAALLYWPDVLIQELKHLVRSSKFDFIKTSAMLKVWWMSDAADTTARDRGYNLANTDKASIVIDPDTCRAEFARDYSNAPYKRVVAPALASTVVAAKTETDAAPDLEEAPTLPAESEAAKTSIVSLTNHTEDESYEQLMERLEKQEQDNFRRKEQVFNKVARILGTLGMDLDQGEGGEDGANLNYKALMDADEDGSLTAGQALAKSMGVSLDRSASRFRTWTPMDQEVHRAYEEGIAGRRNKKQSRSALLAQRQEREALDAQREALRKRFDADSEDAQGDPFLFSEAPVETRVKATADKDVKSVDTDVLAVANAKVFELLREDVSESTPENASTEGTTNLSLPEAVVGTDLTMGNFINSADFEDLLCSLEEEQALQAQDKGAVNDAVQEEESNLASVLRILDEAARVNEGGAAKGDNSMSEFGLNVGKPKVMLKAGMGIAYDPRAIREENATSNEDATPAQAQATKATSVSPNKQPARNTGAPISRRTVPAEAQEDDEDGSEDDEIDDDDAWKNRRKMLKEKAEQRPAPAIGTVDATESIYGYGGTTSINVRNMVAKKPSDNKLQITIERASDRLNTTDNAAEESKVSPTSPHQSSAVPQQEKDAVENSPASITDNTWVDVLSPSPTKEKFSLPSPPAQNNKINIDIEAEDEEEQRSPVILPPKVEAAGMLSDAVRSRKAKGGKLLNVKKQVA